MQFKDIEGQVVVANRLTEIIDEGRVSHAQLFLGESRSGALAMAIAYAQYLSCTNRQHYAEGTHGGLRADACGECSECRKFQQLAHSDLHFYFPSVTTPHVKNKPSSADFQGEFRQFLADKHQLGTLDEWYDWLGVEKSQGMIREMDADHIVRTLGMKSYEGGYKMVIVWMAEKMNVAAANTILKNLEEPAPKTLIILVSENGERLLSTIVSRTQLVRIPPRRIRTQDTELGMLFVSWMRQLFKLNMASLSSWVDGMAAKGREQQKQFLRYAQEGVRECMLRNLAGRPIEIDFGDEKFNASFPAMVTERNAEGICMALDEALRAIERNAYGKIAFMELSFRISKWLKKR